MERITFKSPSTESPSPFWESFVLPILKYKKMTYIIVASSVLATLLYCVLVKNKYTSTATILPSGVPAEATKLKNEARGSLADVGLGVAIQAPENSSLLYPKILRSRLISEKILKRRYSFYHKSKPMLMTMEEYIDAANLDLSLKKLKGLVDIEHDRKTGVISISVTTKYPELSAAVVHAYLEELDGYNIHHRQSKAANNEKFIAGRLKEIKAELVEAEDSLKSFKEQNMNYKTSNDPALELELARLQRNVDLKAALYLTMSQEHELARLEAVKDVPIVRILDAGAVPMVKSSPRRSLYMLGAFAGSLFVSVLLSLWLDLSVKRRFKENLQTVVSSPTVRMGKIEQRLVNRVVRLADIIERAGPSQKVNEQTKR